MSSYKKKVLEARKKILELTAEQLKQIDEIYAKSATRLIDEILDLPDISRTRVHDIDIARMLNEYTKDLYKQLYPNVTENMMESSIIQRQVILDYVDQVAKDRTLSKIVKNNINIYSNKVVKTLIAGEYYKDGKTLSKRLWNLTQENGSKIDEFIKMNIASGANARKLANDLETLINPKKRLVTNNFKAGFDSYKVSYQAQRLARTSITHAATETQIQNAKKNPFDKGLKWNLSASHGARMHGKQDECDDREGKVYKPNETPLQHPNCMCYFTEEVVSIDDAISRINKWVDGAEDSELDAWCKGFERTKKEDVKPRKEKIKVNGKDGIMNVKIQTAKPQIKDATNKDRKQIKFNLDTMKDKSKEDVISYIKNLSEEYNTRLISVDNNDDGNGVKGSVDMAFKMHLSTSAKDTVYHEFAHSIAMNKADKLGITNDNDFWKEIKKVRTQYNKQIRNNPSLKISSYADDSIDEFMAEAFAHSKLKGTKALGYEYGTDFTYSDKVVEIIDKYFKKDTTKNMKDVIINNKISFKSAKTLKEAEEYSVNVLGFNKASFTGIEVNVANSVNKTLGNFYEEFPQLKGFIKEIKTCKSGAPASAQISYKNGELITRLKMSKDDLNNLDNIDDMIKRCVDIKWWTPKDSIDGIIKHELGHMIEYATTLKKYGVDFNTKDINVIQNVFQAIKGGELSAEIRKEALKNLDLQDTKKVVIENLSEYGTKNTKEFLAEAISEKEPRKLAKEVVKILKKKIEVIFND